MLATFFAAVPNSMSTRVIKQRRSWRSTASPMGPHPLDTAPNSPATGAALGGTVRWWHRRFGTAAPSWPGADSVSWAAWETSPLDQTWLELSSTERASQGAT